MSSLLLIVCSLLACLRTCAANPSGSFSCGSNFCCYLQSNGIPVCWGDDFYEQCSEIPTVALSKITCQSSTCCGLRISDSTTICWGGTYNCDESWFSCWQVYAPPTHAFTDVAIGDQGGCGLKLDQTLDCWCPSGWNGGNQFCEPGRWPTFAVTAVQVSGGHAVVIKQDGTLHTWGYLPVAVPSGSVTTQFTMVALAKTFLCGVLAADSTVSCFRRTSAPAEIESNTPSFAVDGLWTGAEHACALRASDHHVFCWGKDYFGELVAPSSIAFSYLSLQQWTSNGVTLDGTILQWGFQRPAVFTTTTTTTTTMTVIQNCSVDDNCFYCRDGAVVAPQPEHPERLMDAGGHCVLNLSSICVDIYTHAPCKADLSSCPSDATHGVKPEYLEPAWYQQCADGGRNYVMGPAGCRNGLRSFGSCIGF